MSERTFRQSVTAFLDYTVDWSDWLAAGDTVESAQWTADAGLTLSLKSNSDTQTTTFVSAAAPGRYVASVSITTVGGRISSPVRLTFIIDPT